MNRSWGRQAARIGLTRLVCTTLASLGVSGCIITVGQPTGDGGPDGGPDALDTVVTSGPSNGTQDDTATFFFTGSGPVAVFECQLDAESFAACASPVTRSGVMPGAHVFSVRALDAAGNVDPTPAQWS